MVLLSNDLPEPASPEVPISLTVAVQEGPFESPGLNPRGVMERFASELRAARLFQGVMFPVPPGADPTWEFELVGKSSGEEPNSNFWKAAVAAAIFPLAFFISLQSDYALELEALFLHDRELLRSYSAQARIQHRYQINADRSAMNVEGFEVLVRAATRELLAQVARDAPFFERASQR